MIFLSKCILFFIFGKSKVEVVKKLLEGDISEDFFVFVLYLYFDVMVLIDCEVVVLRF